MREVHRRSAIAAVAALVVLPAAAQDMHITIRRAGEACSIPDETEEFIAVWLMEEASNATRTNSSTTDEGCGSDCNLLDGGTTSQDTSTYLEGSASAFVYEQGADYLYCANATCNEITGITGSVSWGGLINMDVINKNQDLLVDFDDSTDGFRSRFLNTGDALTCLIGDGGGIHSATGTTALSADTWYMYACVHRGGSDDDITLYLSSDTSWPEATQTSVDDMASTSVNLEASDSGAAGANAWIDEWWVYGGALTSAEVCHICSCGISNWRGCTCSGTSYVGTGANSSFCNSCTLPSDATDPIADPNP